MPHYHLTRASWLSSSAALAGTTALWPRVLRAQTTDLRVGTGAVEANAQIFYAQDQGFFKKAGLNVDIHINRAGSTTAAAVIGGDLQAGVANVVSLGQARLRSVPFVIIAPAAFYTTETAPSVAVVAPNSTIKSGKDLNGTTVGGLSVGGLDQVALWAYIDQTGGDVSTVKFVEISDSAMADALDGGRIACASMGNPQLGVALAEHKVKVLAKAWDSIAKSFMQTAWFTTNDWLAKNKDVARRFADALVDGGKWAMANRDKAPAILEKYSSFRIARANINFGERLDATQIQPVFDASTRYKFFPREVVAADFVWNGK
jgi:NitT/TauT family transport system substrate-binding protein